MSLQEKQIEDVFCRFYKKILSDDLELVGRQKMVQGRRVDLLFIDRNGIQVAVELKGQSVGRKDIGQVIEYAGLMKDTRVILAAPRISEEIKVAFDHYGIEYMEFDTERINSLYKQLGNGSISVSTQTPIRNIFRSVKPVLANTRERDGNVAFKVTYVDSGWRGVCSDGLYQHHLKTRRVFCSEQPNRQPNCRSKEFSDPSVLEFEAPCMDCVALQTLSFSPGAYWKGNRRGESITCKHGKVGKLAVFTSRRPFDSEEKRFIFAVGRIKSILRDDEEIEWFECNIETALTFEETQYPLFWQYYENEGAPNFKFWGTGLFRYWSDEMVRSLIDDITGSHVYSNSQQETARRLREFVS